MDCEISSSGRNTVWFFERLLVGDGLISEQISQLILLHKFFVKGSWFRGVF